MRIRDDDNDVEPLDESDFEDDLSQNATVSTIYGQKSRIHILFAIAMSKLSVICMCHRISTHASLIEMKADQQ